ncbi:MAG: hypothetical protein Q9216_000546 [Gyalolechia sp. 2 TL-2023]
MPRPVLAITFDVAIFSVIDHTFVPKVRVELEVRTGTRQRMAKSMMEKDMIHSLMPALLPVVRLEDRFAEAAPIQPWWIHVAEMGTVSKYLAAIDVAMDAELLRLDAVVRAARSWVALSLVWSPPEISREVPSLLEVGA